MKVYLITSAKYEECYIEEWVKYHLSIGFDKIIINDNNPKDYPYQLKDILKKYIDLGQVVIEQYYDHFGHLDDPEKEFPFIYTWLYHKYENEFDWVAKLDIDEFLEIKETNNDIKKFLQQNKFNNSLSIIVPLIFYSIKPEYCEKYTRLKHNSDRFDLNIKKDSYKLHGWHFKSIIKKTDYVDIIGHHNAFFNTQYDNNKNLICYALPDGQNASFKFYINTFNDNFNDICEIVLNKKQKYFWNISDNICKINHYVGKSAEEWDYKTLKFEADKYNTSPYRNAYLNIKNILKNQRDLYKLYFIDNINNIQED